MRTPNRLDVEPWKLDHRVVGQLSRRASLRIVGKGRLAPILKRRAQLGSDAFVFRSPDREFQDSFKDGRGIAPAGRLRARN
jgi:hypothetical protein